MRPKQEIELMIEALSMAASRHESMGHVTQGRFRFEHDEKASRMRELRARLVMQVDQQQETVERMRQ
jgi:hypothetical protein